MRKSRIRTTAIVAVDVNMGIGLEDSLPWNLPADLEHFKQTTLGGPIIMGRKTHESIGCVLPGRLNIVVSRKPITAAQRAKHSDRLIYVTDIESAIKIGRAWSDERGLDDVFIIGGAEIYKASGYLIDRWVVSHVLGSFKCDTFLEGFLEGFMRGDAPTIQHNQFWIAEYTKGSEPNNKTK